MDFVLMCQKVFYQYIKYKHNIITTNFMFEHKINYNYKTELFVLNPDKLNKFIPFNIGLTDKNIFFHGHILNEPNLTIPLQQPNLVIVTSPIENILPIAQGISPIVGGISPIVEGSNYREAFNALGIQGLNNQNSINPINIIYNDPIVINKPKPPTELLNYQSNILYVMINRLSPRII
jgi:hypothetical protein